MDSSVDKACQFELYLLSSPQPIETGKSVSDMSRMTKTSDRPSRSVEDWLEMGD